MILDKTTVKRGIVALTETNKSSGTEEQGQSSTSRLPKALDELRHHYMKIKAKLLKSSKWNPKQKIRVNREEGFGNRKTGDRAMNYEI